MIFNLCMVRLIYSSFIICWAEDIQNCVSCASHSSKVPRADTQLTAHRSKVRRLPHLPRRAGLQRLISFQKRHIFRHLREPLGTSQDVVNFGKSYTSGSTPGLPNFDVNKLVHGSQATLVTRLLPTSSGEGWVLKRRITGVHENSWCYCVIKPRFI